MSTAVRPNHDQTISKRTRIVEMRLAGHTLQAIADATELAGPPGVRYHLDAWLADQKPSAESTEELRQVQLAQIDALTLKLWPRLDSEDYLAAHDRLVKLMDRKARLMGLDLQPGVQVGVFTAEGMAAFLGWDHQVEAIEAQGVVELEAGEAEA